MLQLKACILLNADFTHRGNSLVGKQTSAKDPNRYATATPHQPSNLCISLKQLAKHLKINPERILNWEKWQHVLWVHIEGLGGYFVSYRQLKQWIAACRTLIRFCPNLETLNILWSAILQEAQRYTEDSLSQLEAIWKQRRTHLSSRQQSP